MPFTERELIKVRKDVLAFCASMTRNSDAAQDLSQWTLMRAWEKREKFQEGTALKSWLFAIARNHFCDEARAYRTKGSRTVALEELSEAGSVPLSMKTLSNQDDNANLRELFRAIEAMPEQKRDAMHLVAIEGVSYEEAAAILQTSVGNVKSIVHRARETLARFHPDSDGPNIAAGL